MKYLQLACLTCLIVNVNISAQNVTAARINALQPADSVVAPLWYLASDELRGRGFDRPELNIAAAYIAEKFKKAGVKPVAGANGYFQQFDAVTIVPATGARVAIDAMVLSTGGEALQFNPGDVSLNAPILYGGEATSTALAHMPVKGKVVVLNAGGDASRRKIFESLSGLQQQLEKQGAAGLVAVLAVDSATWAGPKRYFSRKQVQDPAHTSRLPVFLIRASSQNEKLMSSAARFTANVAGTVVKKVHVKNVLGYIAGTDPTLRKEYVMLSSHYDHLGVGKPQMEEGKLDSIYNGARDNATGTTAVIDAALYFAKYPPKRSIMLATYTAEEQGLIGSSYYSVHPLVPLNKIVYNLNIDNASYNDTTLITLVALGRTTADSMILKATAAYGLHVNNDPTGGRLFSGSDNYPLALKGVPAPTFSLGMTAFDSTIFNRYHRLSDEPGNMNMAYVCKFVRSYTLAASYIANAATAPRWTEGDALEPAWMQLYKK